MTIRRARSRPRPLHTRAVFLPPDKRRACDVEALRRRWGFVGRERRPDRESVGRELDEFDRRRDAQDGAIPIHVVQEIDRERGTIGRDEHILKRQFDARDLLDLWIGVQKGPR